MRLKASGTEIRCVKEGLVLRAPSAPTQAKAFSRVCERHGVGADHVLRVPQVARNGCELDTRDRVLLGAALVRDFVKAGL